MESKTIQSYGIIPIYKDSAGQYHILLVKHKAGGHWGLPKGTPEAGESSMETARRELAEETGISDIEIEPEPTFAEKYTFEKDGIKYNKTNIFYWGQVKKMTGLAQVGEIDDLKWVKITEAPAFLTFSGAKAVVEQLAGQLSHLSPR